MRSKIVFIVLLFLSCLGENNKENIIEIKIKNREGSQSMEITDMYNLVIWYNSAQFDIERINRFSLLEIINKNEALLIITDKQIRKYLWNEQIIEIDKSKVSTNVEDILLGINKKMFFTVILNNKLLYSGDVYFTDSRVSFDSLNPILIPLFPLKEWGPDIYRIKIVPYYKIGLNELKNFNETEKKILLRKELFNFFEGEKKLLY